MDISLWDSLYDVLMFVLTFLVSFPLSFNFLLFALCSLPFLFLKQLINFLRG